METAKHVARCFVWSTGAAALMFCLGSLQALASGFDRISHDLHLDAAPQASLVYDRYNNLVFSFASEDRTNVRLDQISPAVISALLAAEDRYFFKHAGIDVVGLIRAAWVDLRARTIREGGSTITQQLVRQIALTAERSVTRKMKEAMLALRIERRFRKQEILEAYLNRIYFGSGHYGVEAAARGYFNKPARELTVAESALLVGVIPCPAACSPRVDPTEALLRRQGVLKDMRSAGTIDELTYRQAVASDIALAAERRHVHVSEHSAADHVDGVACGLHFLEAVRRQVTDRFGADDVLKGGLRIFTTIDMTLQKHAEEAINKRLAQLDRTGRLEGALAAIDPRSGQVLAIVGGRDFHKSSFNRAMQARRQPGSAFKPLLFAAAVEQGHMPGSLVTDMDMPVQTSRGPWLPSGEHEGASYTMRQALTVSSNRAAVRVMQLVGITTTQTYARRLGIHSPLPAVPSLALGTGEVTLLDLTSAYGVFANGGIMAPPTLITRIEDRDGNVLWQSSLERSPYCALRPGTEYLMSSMLADVLNRGTGSRARAEGFRLPAAGKTGTSDDYADAWFIGYTPQLVAGVWFGYDQKRTIMNRGFAGKVAVPAWADFMKKATAGSKPGWFEMPSDVERVTVCLKTGNRAARECDSTSTDYFMVGTGPYETCSALHTDLPMDLLAPSAAGATTALSVAF